MQEIKDLLIKILEESPEIAIWVLLILYGYKVVVVGSVYAVLRYVTQCICGTIKRDRVVTTQYKLGRYLFAAEGITELEDLIQSMRPDGSGFVPSRVVRDVRDAWEKSVAEKLKKV